MSYKILCSSHLDWGLHGLEIRDLLLHTPPTTFYYPCTHGCMDDLLWSSCTVIRMENGVYEKIGLKDQEGLYLLILLGMCVDNSSLLPLAMTGTR